MRVSEMRELSSDELERQVAELAEEVFRVRLKRATSQLENPMRPRQARRELARAKTILAQKRAQEEQASGKEN